MMVGEHLDLSSDPNDDGSDAGRSPIAHGDAPTSNGRRPFLGVRFVCCDVYARVYVNGDRTAYEGCCPRCRRPLAVRIAPGGSTSRFFDAG